MTELSSFQMATSDVKFVFMSMNSTWKIMSHNPYPKAHSHRDRVDSFRFYYRGDCLDKAIVDDSLNLTLFSKNDVSMYSWFWPVLVHNPDITLWQISYQMTSI